MRRVIKIEKPAAFMNWMLTRNTHKKIGFYRLLESKYSSLCARVLEFCLGFPLFSEFKFASGNSNVNFYKQ